MDSSDETLMLRYRDGDLKAFDRLYQRHNNALYRFILRQCGDAATAEELFQDVWLKLISARGRYRAEAKFTTYLYRIAHHRLVDHYRLQARRPHLCDNEIPDPAALADPQPQPDQQEQRRRRALRLLGLLEQLPQPQREAFLLRAEAGMSLGQIAAVTGVSQETAKSRLRYAVAKLRQQLGPSHD